MITRPQSPASLLLPFSHSKLEEFEYLCGAVEADRATLLSERERRHSDRDEAILAQAGIAY
jgi:hypothetical protein